MNPTEENLTFAKQLGVTDIITGANSAPGKKFWDYQPLLRLRTRIETAGLRLAAIENLPLCHYDKIKLGKQGRDDQIRNWGKTLENMGAAGIPILGYYWFINYWRTNVSTLNRGGARTTSFNYEQVKNAPLSKHGIISDEQMWDNYEYFIRKIIPLAENANVKLALHPDDPPVSPIAGIANIFRSPEAFKKAFELVPSKNNALDFCQGCFSEMGIDVIESIRYFGLKKKILYVHFRNVAGNPYDFTETFIDNGQTNMLKAMQTYKEVGFDGPMAPDHMPRIDNDTEYGHGSVSFALGYMKALMKCVEK
jgi:mannonate dehydratase